MHENVLNIASENTAYDVLPDVKMNTNIAVSYFNKNYLSKILKLKT